MVAASYPCPLHATFLTHILPRVVLHARIFFRGERCPGKRDDRIAEATAIAWKWYRVLVKRGKDPAQFPARFATLAALAVKNGRKVSGMEKAKDVLNSRAQVKHAFTVGSMPMASTLTANPFAEALTDNTQTEIPEQVAFRLDFPAWLGTRTHRDRRIIEGMGKGERTSDLADRFGLSEARVSQMRCEFKEDWLRFTDHPAVA